MYKHTGGKIQREIIYSYAGVDLKPDEYLRLGQLFLDPNQNIVPSDYLNQIYSGYGTPEASDSYSLGFWYFFDHFQMRGLDGQIVAINFDDEIVIARNSLYLAPSGERVVDLDQTIPVAPVTLPEAVGGTGVFDFSDFLDIFYIESTSVEGDSPEFSEFTASASTVDVTSATGNTDVFFTLRVTDASGIDEPIDQWGYPAISSSWLHKSDSPLPSRYDLDKNFR